MPGNLNKVVTSDRCHTAKLIHCGLGLIVDGDDLALYHCSKVNVCDTIALTNGQL